MKKVKDKFILHDLYGIDVTEKMVEKHGLKTKEQKEEYKDYFDQIKDSIFEIEFNLRDAIQSVERGSQQDAELYNACLYLVEMGNALLCGQLSDNKQLNISLIEQGLRDYANSMLEKVGMV